MNLRLYIAPVTVLDKVISHQLKIKAETHKKIRPEQANTKNSQKQWI